MKNKKDEKLDAPPKEIELVVTEEDYRRDIEAGMTEEETLKPGRHKLKRGGFLKRHPELKDKMRKRA